MGYVFPPDLAQLIHQRLATGGYASENDVLRDALRALEEIADYQPDRRVAPITSFEQLRREVGRGLDQLDRGEGRECEEVFEALLRDLPGAK